MMPSVIRRLLPALSGLVLAAATAEAHRPDESYVFLSLLEGELEGRYEARFPDVLRQFPDLDTDGNGTLSVAEFEAGQDRVRAYVSRGLYLASADAPLRPEWIGSGVIEVELGRYVAFNFRADNVPPGSLTLESLAFLEEGSPLRTLVVVEYDSVTGERNDADRASLILSPREPRQSFDPTIGRRLGGVPVFVREGIRHIWIGTDHVLFLLALVLPAVIRRRDDGGWQPETELRAAAWYVFKVVTLFTIAHSVTLSLAALDVVRPPIQWVEVIIAASVAVAALHAARGGRKLGVIIFLFGLFHGFGFAAVLGHLSIDRRFLVPTLLGFNVGVEIGQLVILLVAFPVLWALRRWRGYPILLRTAGWLIAALAVVWVIERSFEWTLLGI